MTVATVVTSLGTRATRHTIGSAQALETTESRFLHRACAEPRIVAADPGDTHPRNLRRTARVPAPLASHARSSSESVVETSGATP